MYKLAKLNELAIITTGFPFKGEMYSDEGVRVVRGENVTIGSLRWDSIKCWNQEFEQYEKYSLKDGDVVIGMDGSRVGKNRARIKASDLPLLLAQRVACLRSNKSSNQEFIYYLIRAKRFDEFVERIQTGSSVPHISQKQIEEFVVPFPTLEEQKKIAKILLSLDAKIELNNRINSELGAMAKMLYDYWFVQFNFPATNGKPYKISGGMMGWNKELKREIPAGWKVGKASDLFSINPSLSLKQGSLCSYIDMNALPTEGFMTKEVQTKEFNGGVKFQNGDIVVARITPCLENGKTGLISLLRDEEIGFGSTEFIVIRGKELKLSSFAACLSRSELFRKYAIANMTGTSGRKRVDASAFEIFSMAIPPKELLVKFEESVSAFFEKTTLNTKENQQLSSLRDWLLPMLMNGQVTVGKTEEKTSYEIEERMNIAAEP